ncbi:hypothetical protein [Rhizobium sp. L43]|uniref:hypothetical protein n=1 Tax=Rhizobium sp. L43 TaxID=2035452 RepID=UPI00117ADC5C|nr:hypothetical protein [Rhizobium sp. L43]
MPDIAQDKEVPLEKPVPPPPIEQPIGAIGYAVLGFLNLFVAIAIAIGIFYAGRQLTAQPTMHLFNYVLLAVLGITTALFLFGAMRSGAALTSKKLDTSVELGGPVVVAVLVVVGGYYFTKAPSVVPLTFQLPPDSALTPNLSSDVKLVVDLPGRRETLTFNSNGEGTIQQVSYGDVGRLMQITLQSNEYKFENNQRTVDVPIPDNWKVPLTLIHISEDERKQQKLKAIYLQLIEDINLELVRKDAMLFPAIEDYLNHPSVQGWERVKVAAGDSERRINASLDKELEIRSESELIESRRRMAASINDAPEVKLQGHQPVLNDLFQQHRQRADILENIPTVILPSREQVIMWRDQMKIHYLEMKDMVRSMTDKPEI